MRPTTSVPFHKLRCMSSMHLIGQALHFEEWPSAYLSARPCQAGLAQSRPCPSEDAGTDDGFLVSSSGASHSIRVNAQDLEPSPPNIVTQDVASRLQIWRPLLTWCFR